MNITLNGIKITQDNKTLAFEKNNNVDEIVVTVDTDESWSYKLDVKYPDKYNTESNALYILLIWIEMVIFVPLFLQVECCRLTENILCNCVV